MVSGKQGNGRKRKLQLVFEFHAYCVRLACAQGTWILRVRAKVPR